MKSRITMNGMNRYLPPAIAKQGDCTAIVNLRKSSESLSPIGLPQPLYTPEGEERKLICIHTCYDGEHHITQDNHGLYYEVLLDTESDEITVQSTCIFETEGITVLSTRTIGNTLVVICPEHIYYLLYKEGEYISLGERPEIPIISFFPGSQRTISQPIEAHDFSKTYTNPSYINRYDEQHYDPLYYSAFFQCQEMAWEEHRFIRPILVRYAITLYDGSRIYASAPVLVGDSDEPIQPYQMKLRIRNTETVCFGTVAGNVTAKTYKLQCKIHQFALNNWKDVIRSIDIFVAPEVTIFETDMDVTKSEAWLYYSIEKKVDSNNYITYWLTGKPYFDQDKIQERHLENSLFYKIASLDNWDELTPDSQHTIECKIRPDQLVHEEILSIDNTTLLSTGAKISYIHNKRLHIANLTKRLFSGFPIGIYNVGHTDSPLSAEVYIRTYLKNERGESQVVWHGESDAFYNLLSPLISYPDSNAYKMEIVAQVANERYSATFDLKPSKYENRADYLDPSLKPIAMSCVECSDPLNIPLPENDVYIQPNILRVSEYENPFIFPAEMTYTISNSAITGVASITSALSEGQFGEFSIYLFTEEGIWALQNGEGIVCYEAQHQLNRIGFLAGYPIVPLETGVLFMTEKGIFALQGAMTQELLTFDEAAYENLTPAAQQESDLSAILSDTTTLSDFIKGCKVAYNPAQEELVCSHPDHPYTLAIHLPTLYIYRIGQVYTHLFSDATHLFAQDETGKIYNLQKEIPQSQSVALVTRPISLQPEEYQRWREVCWRMAMKAGNLQLSLWGGNNAEGEFALIARGNTAGEIPGQALMRLTSPPYKYFCLVLSGEVSPDFHLSAIDISATLITDNRLR